MNQLVFRQGATTREVSLADVTFVWLVAGVRALVSLHVAVVAESGVTDTARERFLACVRAFVAN